MKDEERHRTEVVNVCDEAAPQCKSECSFNVLRYHRHSSSMNVLRSRSSSLISRLRNSISSSRVW